MNSIQLSFCRSFPQRVVVKLASLLLRFGNSYMTGGGKRKLIHCIGDSHTSFFSGQDEMQPVWPEPAHQLIPLFKTYRLGPVLAYNLCKHTSSSRGREKLFAVLQNIPKGSRILLCFGEIDCRVHLPRRVLNFNEPLDKVVTECVERYFSVILEIQKLGFQVSIWNVIPSTPKENTDYVEYAPVGSCSLRNRITCEFNEGLKVMCRTCKIPFVSIYDKLVDSQGITNLDYYMDEIHLSQKAMPFALHEIQNLLCANSSQSL